MVSLLQEQARALSRYGMKKHLRILPMYSGLPYAEQMKVFERAPSSVRKVNGFFFLWFFFVENSGCLKFDCCFGVSNVQFE